MDAWSVAERHFVDVFASAVRELIPVARCHIPSGTQDTLCFKVRSFAAGERDLVIRHLHPGPFSFHIPWAAGKLNVRTQAAGGKSIGIRFSGEKIGPTSVQIRTSGCRSTDAKSLTNRVPSACGPVAILVVVENTTRIHQRRIHELSPRIPFSLGEIDLYARHTRWGYLAVIAINDRHIDQWVNRVVIAQIKRADSRCQLTGANIDRSRFPES